MSGSRCIPEAVGRALKAAADGLFSIRTETWIALHDLRNTLEAELLHLGHRIARREAVPWRLQPVHTMKELAERAEVLARVMRREAEELQAALQAYNDWVRQQEAFARAEAELFSQAQRG